ncbi:hypothetical protein MMC25_000937 [Agyrium rufum]|nr:hypothetical protein [Agyrium rufum]
MSDETSANLKSLLAGLTENDGSSLQTPQYNFSPTPQNGNRSLQSFDFSSAPSQSRNNIPVGSTPPPQMFQSLLNGGQSRPSSSLNQPSFSSNRSTPVPARSNSGADQTATLLNLLKFNSSATPNPSLLVAGSPNATQQMFGAASAQPAQNHGRGISASDLVASLNPKPSSASFPTSFSRAPSLPPKPNSESTKVPSGNPQDYLLQLLNRKSTAQYAQAATAAQIGDKAQEHGNNFLGQPLGGATDTPMRSPTDRKNSPIRIFGTGESREPTPFDPQVTKMDSPKASIFSYVDPFEQLAASSPRNSKARSGANSPAPARASSRLNVQESSDEAQRKKTKHSPASTLTRELTPGGSEVLQSIEFGSGDSGSTKGKSRIESLLGIGAPTNNSETVAEALNEVGDQVSKQVDRALAASREQVGEGQVKEETLDEDTQAALNAIEDTLQEAAIEIKEELDREENRGALEDNMPPAMAESVKEIIDQAASGNVDGKSDMDGETLNDGKDTTNVPVYQFPVKPFVSIDLKPGNKPLLQLREESVLEIARLKKDFDQIDRTLATASGDFIVYALPRSGGLRIIRQDDGQDCQIFKDNQDRIFNTTISTTSSVTSPPNLQTVVATGVSGSVYWAQIGEQAQESMEGRDMEKDGLIFPPVPAHDDNTSGGQLKTRAKKSNRHPTFFAIGRGKTIQIVFPFHAKESALVQSSLVDSEKYFKERTLKIHTGKAGKDFAFSEDDSVIATLDKNGRLRFWDVTELTNPNNGIASRLAPLDVKIPILGFSTANPTEKSWPTSVLFVDKLRPYTKGSALRYMIVGLKQNHTLQLWDLGLGKAVQELNFPHDNESDAICSVAYHPASAIVVLGHPSRNSIYLLHLSAPKYNLPSMSQAKYMNRLAAKDSTLFKPQSTAIMSGVREYSFLSRGTLRSLELLPSTPESAKGEDDADEPTLFELYAMHSKGVTCLSFKKSDLGWGEDNRVLRPIDAEVEGQIVVRELVISSSLPMSEPSSVNGDMSQATSALSSEAKVNGKKAKSKETKSDTVSEVGLTTASSKDLSAIVNGGSEKGESKKKKKSRTKEISAETPAPKIPEPQATIFPSTAQSPAAEKADPVETEEARPPITKSHSIEAPELVPRASKSPSKRDKSEDRAPILSSDLIDKALGKVEATVSSTFSKVLGDELQTLHRKIQEDKRVQDAAGVAKQEAVLRLVSSTLTENIDKALARHINASIKDEVLPAINTAANSTIQQTVADNLSKTLDRTISTSIKSTLPDAISRAVQNPEVLRIISEHIGSKVAVQVEKDFALTLHNSITPAFQNLATTSAAAMASDIDRRAAENFQKAEYQHQVDSQKIDQLTNLVKGLSDTLHSMATAQSQFQGEILRLQQQIMRDRTSLGAAPGGGVARSRGLSGGAMGSASGKSSSVQPMRSPSPIAGDHQWSQREAELTPDQKELLDIAQLMEEGYFEEATVRWVKSTQQGALFDNFFRHRDPSYLRECQPLVTLSVSAAVSSTLETNLMKRLEWLEVALSCVSMTDPDIRSVVPKIMGVLAQRLEGIYMRINETESHHPALRKIPLITRAAREIAAGA